MCRPSSWPALFLTNPNRKRANLSASQTCAGGVCARTARGREDHVCRLNHWWCRFNRRFVTETFWSCWVIYISNYPSGSPWGLANNEMGCEPLEIERYRSICPDNKPFSWKPYAFLIERKSRITNGDLSIAGNSLQVLEFSACVCCRMVLAFTGPANWLRTHDSPTRNPLSGNEPSMPSLFYSSRHEQISLSASRRKHALPNDGAEQSPAAHHRFVLGPAASWGRWNNTFSGCTEYTSF